MNEEDEFGDEIEAEEEDEDENIDIENDILPGEVIIDEYEDEDDADSVDLDEPNAVVIMQGRRQG